ncbi:hypothetical protein M404DRAFT_995828 [Pisolithus tinctorius Marx 270]|uniref:Uncharacterized protein n=1 Tax=Pisolithus tinctorius Marx 270 TaxID=870435 RepID=A0A0C3PN86_PISTI|nr:hypothetical protein M404DRAFT_995828 [Pisolithus tinctorius Marx 270]
MTPVHRDHERSPRARAWSSQVTIRYPRRGCNLDHIVSQLSFDSLPSRTSQTSNGRNLSNPTTPPKTTVISHRLTSFCDPRYIQHVIISGNVLDIEQ